MRWVWILLTCFAFSVFAENGPPISLEKVRINVKDQAAILRGGKFFAQNCMVCHTMKYLKHNKLAKEAGVTLDKMPLNQKEWIYDIAPPDLTLLARRHSADWIYTYLHSFYKDPSRPTGSNNLLKKEINMPNILLTYQGEQILSKQGKRLMAEHSWRKPSYYSVLELVKSGSMSPEQFNATMKDLVTFFAYASDPQRIEHEHLGLWVIGFLLVLLVLSYLLKKAYWEDVDK